jgi:hypothetical protein
MNLRGGSKLVNHNDVDYTENDLYRIGDEVASIWGGNCRSFELDKKNKTVIFHCVENGEDFCSTLTYDELAKYKQNEGRG